MDSTQRGPRLVGARCTGQHLGRSAMLICALLLGITGLLSGVTASPASASGPVAHAVLPLAMTWQQILPDAGAPIGQSSPMQATLDGGGPSVVVGDRAGNLWASHLANGSPVGGWPAHTGGAPIDSTPSVIPNGSGTDNVFAGAGNAAQSRVGGYYAFTDSGSELWGRNAEDPNGLYGVQASMAVGNLNGVPSAVAPSLGQEELRSMPSTVRPCPGGRSSPRTAVSPRPRSLISTETGRPRWSREEVVPGLAYGVNYSAGGHLRVIGAGGNLICDYDTNQTVDSSPAVGNFLAGGQTGIAFGTGSFYPGAPDSNTLFGSDSHCNIVWRTNLGGNTAASPALGDLEGDGNLEVLEGVDTGSSGLVWALNGSNGAAIAGMAPGHPGRIIGGITTADLTGGGYNDVLVPTTDGVVIYDGRSAQVVATLGVGNIGIQNSPMVSDRSQRDHRNHHRRLQRTERRSDPALGAGRIQRQVPG